MKNKSDSGLKQLKILVIADQERIIGTFELCREIPGTRIATASGIDEGIRAAAKNTPDLLFVQSRMGGLSGEIIIRHLRLELKERKTRIVLLCEPAETPAPGNKSCFAAIDISLPDDQLTEQVRELVMSQLRGEARPPLRSRKMTAGKKSADNPARSAPEPVKPEQEQEQEILDFVEISAGRDVAEAPPANFRPAEKQTTESDFREKLDHAMERTSLTAAAEDIAATGRKAGAYRPVPTGTGEERPEIPSAFPPSASRKKWGIRAVAAAGVLLLAVGMLLLWRGLPSAPEKAGDAGPPLPALTTPIPEETVPAIIPATGSEGATGEGETGSSPPADDGEYLEYTVRRGDTLFTILTKRFGLSPRMAERLIPEILEKNGISRSTTLNVGRKILIPAEVKIRLAR